MAVQSMIISIGGMILQSIVNGFGVVFVAGFTATNKLYGLLEIVAVSMGFAVSYYAGQNLEQVTMTNGKIGVRKGAAMVVVIFRGDQYGDAPSRHDHRAFCGSFQSGRR